MNWDVAINSIMRTMGVGIIVRENKGQVHAAYSKTILSMREPVVAEATGALFAVEFSRDLGIQDVDLEGDSLQVVQAIRDSGIIWSRYGHITGDTRWVLNSLRSWIIGHVKRVANSAAHHLAKEAVRGLLIKSGWRKFLCVFSILFL